MARILIIGGSGEFGQRLARRLDAAGHEILVAGRSLDRAARLCAQLQRARPVLLDRNQAVGLVLARERPALVIDAAGPFQGSDYRVAEACIAMHIGYCDIADGRDFVGGIGVLDAAARSAGVPVMTGASSVPALSGAVVRHLASGIDHVDAVDIVITTSNRASAGESVARAILSYVGRPIRLWDGARWVCAHGWQQMRRFTARMGTAEPLPGRWVALADVPDLDGLVDRLPGRPAVRFFAGTELAIEMIALWLLSWPVRWGWVRSLDRLAGWLMPVYRALLHFGGDRSAMQVTLCGGGVKRQWTLIAEQGHGPEIPTMAAELLAEEILAGRCAPGARSAADALALGQFAPLFARFAIRHETSEVAQMHNGRPDAGPPIDMRHKDAA